MGGVLQGSLSSRLRNQGGGTAIQMGGVLVYKLAVLVGQVVRGGVS